MSSAGNKKNEINYSEWREKWVELNEEEKQSVEDRINSFPLRLSFTLLLDTQGHDSADVFQTCLLYTSDAADEGLGVDLGGRRII